MSAYASMDQSMCGVTAQMCLITSGEQASITCMSDGGCQVVAGMLAAAEYGDACPCQPAGQFQCSSACQQALVQHDQMVSCGLCSQGHSSSCSVSLGVQPADDAGDDMMDNPSRTEAVAQPNSN
jgi:hypothetical protein